MKLNLLNSELTFVSASLVMMTCRCTLGSLLVLFLTLLSLLNHFLVFGRVNVHQRFHNLYIEVRLTEVRKISENFTDFRTCERLGLANCIKSVFNHCKFQSVFTRTHLMIMSENAPIRIFFKPDFIRISL